MMQDTMRIIELEIRPVLRNRIGNVRIAPPTMEVKTERIVVMLEFVRVVSTTGIVVKFNKLPSDTGIKGNKYQIKRFC